MELSWILIAASLIATGIVAGVLSGLLGVGGGIVIVPALYFLFQLLGMSSATAMSVATGTSLLVIIGTSLSSVRSHHGKGNVDFTLLRLWSPFIVFGAVVGALLASYIGGVLATTVFSVVVLCMALNMIMRDTSLPLVCSAPNRILQLPCAAMIGFISVIMGIGGGALGVPCLRLCHFPVHRAVGTAAAFGFLIAVPGAVLMMVVAHAPADAPVGTLGFINLPGFALIAPLSMLMAPVGVRLGSMVSSVVLTRLFAAFLFVTGIHMLYQALRIA